jgi:hypothetical protein
VWDERTSAAADLLYLFARRVLRYAWVARVHGHGCIRCRADCWEVVRSWVILGEAFRFSEDLSLEALKFVGQMI